MLNFMYVIVSKQNIVDNHHTIFKFVSIYIKAKLCIINSLTDNKISGTTERFTIKTGTQLPLRS